ncbi:MAG: C4-dicarboxylate transporter DctA [Proteobacteria bacterium]|nr:C4-dicarboxylate transporter DctA [Pseudomonadota bacterium]
MKKIPLYFQVLIAIIFAVIFGVIFPEQAQAMKPLGDGFIKLIKMCITPLIFTTIVAGIVSSIDLKKIGKLGLKTLIYFEVVTTFALFIGLLVTYFLKPGSGMNIDPSSLDIESIKSYTAQSSHQNFTDFLLNIIPNSIFQPFVSGDILSVLLVAIIFAVALVSMQDRAKSIIIVVHELKEVIFKIITFVIKLAPIGAFGAMSFTIGKYGTVILWPMLKLMICFYTTCILFVLLVFGLLLKLCGHSIFKLLSYLKEEIFLVFGASSSEVALPNLMKKMEELGCKKSVVSLVVPTGYSFNLDGTCIYFTMAITFIAQAFNIDLSLGHFVGIILVLLITSKGAAGVVGTAFITLATTLTLIPQIPLSGLVLVLGIDRFMSEARAVTNFIGNATAVLVIDKLEK